MKITSAMMSAMRNEHELIANTLEKVAFSAIRGGGKPISKYILDTIKRSKDAAKSRVVKGQAKKRTKLKGSIV